MAETIIEILIDQSGSMGYMKGAPEHEGKYLVDGMTRMTLIKKVIIDEVIPTIDYANKIIIRTFRNQSKLVGGKSVDEISIPIIYDGCFDEQKLLEVIISLKDPEIGGTPITAAINAAISDLGKYPNSDRKIILLTDGEENGTGDYRLAAKQALELEGIPCKIFIIGIDQNDVSEEKSKSIATGGYYNIKSKSFINNDLKKVLAPLKKNVLQNTIQNIQATTYNSDLQSHQESHQNIQLKTIAQTVENKIKTLELENRKSALYQLDELETKIKEQVFNTQQLLSELSTLKEFLRADLLFETGIGSTTLTIDEGYSEKMGQASELFLYKLLCDKYGKTNVKWMNQTEESFMHHDFELLDQNGKTIQLIECKGTAMQKPTFYLTTKEWSHFLEYKEIYQIYRVFNVESEMNAVCIENLFDSILKKRVVPYLLQPEILKEERVFLTLLSN